MSLPINSTKWIQCNRCNCHTEHVIQAAYHVTKNNDDDIYWNDYAVAECAGCKTVAFIMNMTCGDDRTETEPDQWEVPDNFTLFPPRNSGRPALSNTLLPDEVKRVYNETIAALQNNLPVLAGIGMRGIVEAVCNHKKVKSSNLVGKINGLVTLGVLSKDGATILHAIRTLGNDATPLGGRSSHQLGAIPMSQTTWSSNRIGLR